MTWKPLAPCTTSLMATLGPLYSEDGEAAEVILLFRGSDVDKLRGSVVWLRDQIGGELWIDPNVDFVHVGRKAWTGNFLRYLQANCKVQLAPAPVAQAA